VFKIINESFFVLEWISAVVRGAIGLGIAQATWGYLLDWACLSVEMIIIGLSIILRVGHS